jgi:2-polyprenyl-3-methyl-5-hydroxy-6-metoxy-1,4-benzoquinol methylase
MPQRNMPNRNRAAADAAFEDLFDRDYLEFYAAELCDDTNDDEAHAIAELLQLQKGQRLLDLPCGHGRIARRLAAMGAVVTGVDRSELFLEHARGDAAKHHVEVHYQRGDMRTISFDGEFDLVVNWFTSFGYEDDYTLRTMLTRMHRALVPGGRLLLETLNLHDCDLQSGERSQTKELHDEHGTHFLIDRSSYDPHDGRLHVRRFIARSGQPTRTIPYQLRLFTLTELASWLRAAGFANVQAFGAEGEVFRTDSARLIMIAQKA